VAYLLRPLDAEATGPLRWLSYTKRFVEGLTYTNQSTGEAHPVVEEVRGKVFWQAIR